MRFVRLLKNIHNNNKKFIVRVRGCHQCPLVKLNRNYSCSCRAFHNKGKKLILKIVNDVDEEKNTINEFIQTPFWCGLVSNENDIEKDTKTYIIKENSLLVSSNNVEKNLPIVDANVMHDISYDFDVGIDKLNNELNEEKDYELDGDMVIPTLVAASLARGFNETTINDDVDYQPRQLRLYNEYDDSYGIYPIHRTVKPKPLYLDICSSCGCKDATVKRDENMGMCQTCIDSNKTDKKIFINNFRLKRNIPFSKEEFTII
jgi:hypothetical protein